MNRPNLCRRAARLGALLALPLSACTASPVASQAPDATAPPDLTTVGDALPTGAISFFKAQSCPGGWDLYQPAMGRAISPTVGTGAAGVFAGTPLQSAEDRVHVHPLSGQLAVGSVSFAGIAGEANHGAAQAGAQGFSAMTDGASGGLPYVQYLVCQKSAPPVPAKRPLPQGLLLFFAQPACPDGWAQAGPTQGRHLVGLPDKAQGQLPFGGPPLGTIEQRAHTHAVGGQTDLPAHGIALISGCCAGGYGQSGHTAFTATAGAAEVGLPYVQLLQCVKL